MATINAGGLDELISLGFQPGKIYPLPKDPMEASRESVEAFVCSHDRGCTKSSGGQIHITGPAVHRHSAPIKVVGNLLLNLQDGVDAIGAKIYNIFSDTGALPKSVTDRTRLSISASPLPGSVIINVVPEYTEQGKSEQEFLEEPPLSDRAFKQLLELISSFPSIEKDQGDFVEKMAEYGSRVAAALSKICETVASGKIDIEMKWDGENGETICSYMTNDFAKEMGQMIANADIRNEQEEIEGSLITLTKSSKDKLRILTGENEEKTFSLGAIPLGSIDTFHVGDRVKVKIEKITSKKVGGKIRESFTGISISPIP